MVMIPESNNRVGSFYQFFSLWGYASAEEKIIYQTLLIVPHAMNESFLFAG